MNTRMPFYPPQMPPAIPEYYNTHNGYRPQPNWNGIRTNLPANGWNRNRPNVWKRPRTWQYRDSQPYSTQKKPYNGRNKQRYDNGYEGSKPSWPSPKKFKTNGDSKDLEHMIPGTVATKKKRKPMSKSYPTGKWDLKDAEKALQAERDFNKNLKKQSLIVRFPDPDLDKPIVKQFHPAIENVHFPQASTPRYCYVHLEDNSDLNTVMEALKKIKFGQGFLSVEIKNSCKDNADVSAKDIDPFTLYVGNLPTTVTKAAVMKVFPTSARIDIGHPQQMKNTRYAFVRFFNVDDAVASYKKTRNTQFESRSLIVRFRRINGNVGVPGETKLPNPPKTKTEPIVKTPSPDSPSASETGESSMISTASTSTSVQMPPDLTLVKEEPESDDEEYFDNASYTNSLNDVEVKQEVKTEQPDLVNAYDKNEDDVDEDEEEEEFDMENDNFQYNVGALEDECDDSEDYDDYEDMEEMGGMQLDVTNTWLPEDDDHDFFNGN